MPVIADYRTVAQATLDNPAQPWRKMIRCDTPGGQIDDVNAAVNGYFREKLVLAEGDSWFDKFTPIPQSGTNLLEEIRLPFHTVVVDISTIGDESRDMVRGWQARQTKVLLDFYDFDALLLSAGGNDLKNLYADRLAELSVGGLTPQEIIQLAQPSYYTGFFQEVVANIRTFVEMRDNSSRAITRNAPILLHGYDYIQPRPAGAAILSGSQSHGSWIYPIMHGAGLTDAQMRSAADAVVDELNRQLAAFAAGLDNVLVIDSRGVLTPAAPQTSSDSHDWMDEIHPNRSGFRKLAHCCWNRTLATALGWQAAAGDLVPPCPRPTASTAWNDRDDGSVVLTA